MNRFASKSVFSSSSPKRIFRYIPLVIGLIVIIAFLIGVNYVGSSSIEKQQESLENAITRDIAQCYAVEGTYPPSLQYLKDHYGLTYNEDLFFVDYRSIGSNILPDVTIIRTNN